jgi:TP901 family phage tail tape measure protein
VAETEIKVKLTGDETKLVKSIKNATNSLDKFSAKSKKLGKTLMMKATLPLVGFGAAAMKTAMDFEHAMHQIESLVGLSAEAVQAFEKDVKSLSGETARAPKELAEAMFFITSAGLRGAVAVEALEASAKAAAIGMGSTIQVADAVTNAINGYGAANLNATLATDILAKTVEQGKASAQDLAPQFGRIIPLAAELGISFDQVGASLAFLTRSSGDAAMSATQTMNVMKSILKPSQQARGVLDEIGFSLEDLRKAASEDLLGALQLLRARLEANGFEMSQVFEDVRGLTGALQLTGVQAADARMVFDELAQSSGKLAEGFAVAEHTAKQRFGAAMVEIKLSMLELGAVVTDVVLPIIVTLTGWIKDVSEWFHRLSPAVQQLVVVMSVFAAVLGPLLWVIGSVTAAITALNAALLNTQLALGPIVIAITAAVAAAALLFFWLNRVDEEAIAAKARQEDLTIAFRESGDEAATLTIRLDELIDRYKTAQDVIDGTVESIGGFEGAAIMAGLALERDVGVALAGLKPVAGELIEVMEEGGSVFEHFYAMMSGGSATGTADELMRTMAVSTGAVGQALMALKDDQNMSTDAFLSLLSVLRDTEAAYADHIAHENAVAKATLGVGEAMEDVTNLAGVLGAALDTEVVDAAIRAAEASGDWAGELADLYDQLEVVAEDAEAAALVIEMAERAITAADAATVAWAMHIGAMQVPLEEWETALVGVDEAHIALMETERARKDWSSRQRVKSLQDEEQAIKDAEMAHAALLDVERRRKNASTMRHIDLLQQEELAAKEAQLAHWALLETERARKQHSSDNWAVNGAQLLNDALGVTARELLDVADLERMILGIREQSLEQTKDATKNVISLLRADRQVRMTEKAINALLDERNELLGVGTDEETMVAQMEAQQEAINDVEVELLGMAGELGDTETSLQYLTQAQAEANDITGQQAQSLIDATRALYEATKAEAMGYGTVIDLTAARERLAEVQNTIFTGAQEVADAQDRLREIDEGLTTAAEDLALQELAVNDAQRLVAESGDLAYAAAESLSAMFTTVLGPSADGVSEKMNELARSLVEEADKVFPEFDAMRIAMEGITFGMTDDQIDVYVRSVMGMVSDAQTEIGAILAADPPTLDMVLNRPSTAALQEVISELEAGFIVAGQVVLPPADSQEMIDTIQTAFDNAGLRLPTPELDAPSALGMITGLQEAFDNAALDLPPPGLTTPNATTMIQEIQQALTDAELTLNVDVLMETVDPATAATLAWLQTAEAAEFLGVTAMASGGIVNSPTLALIGEAGPEAVIPLGKGGGIGGGTNVTVNVAGSVLTEGEIGEIVQEQLLRIQTRNQTLEFA